MVETQSKEKSVSFQYKLCNVFNCIKHLDEVVINTTDKGLEIWGMNESNTIMTEVKVSKDDLENYDFKEPIEITTDIDYLKIVKRLALVKAYIDESKIVFEEDKAKVEIPLYDRGKKEKPNLDLKKSVSFNLSNIDVRKTLKDIEAIGSDSFYLEFKDKTAVFKAIGNNGIVFEKKLSPYEKGIKRFEKKDNSIKVGLSTELFRYALNGMTYSIRITLAENSPTIIENINDDDYLKIEVKHLIAPRYEE